MTEITFRQAQQKDLSAIMDIEHAAFPYGVHESLAVYAERLGVFPEGFRVLQKQENVIGFICSERWEAGTPLTAQQFQVGHSIQQQHRPDGSDLYISSMGLHPRHHGQGLGKILFEQFLTSVQETMPGLQTMTLIVSEHWHSARNIYARHGFAEIARFPDFFSNETTQQQETGMVLRRICAAR